MSAFVRADAPCYRAELTIGTRAGYKGAEIVTQADLVTHIEQYQQRLDPWYAVVVWGTGWVIGPSFPTERVIKLSLESNPLYTPEATEDEIRRYAICLADYLAHEFEQVRIYVAIYPIRSLIVEAEQAP